MRRKPLQHFRPTHLKCIAKGCVFIGGIGVEWRAPSIQPLYHADVTAQTGEMYGLLRAGNTSE